MSVSITCTSTGGGRIVFRRPAASFRFYHCSIERNEKWYRSIGFQGNSISSSPDYGQHSSYPKLKLLLPPPHASSASLGGSDGAAPYSEQLTDAKGKKKSKKIAGIDQDELLDPQHLADPDSCFCEFNGVTIHHKLHNPHNSSQAHSLSHASLNLPFPIILLHGFGASVFSWNRVMKPLADLTASKVLAFDRPAFGLTSRLHSFTHSSSSAADDTKRLNPYSMAFSVLATLYFIDFLAAEKAVLVGHSAGSLVAVDAYFEAPERVAALILVAPAILAPNVARKGAEGNKMRKDKQTEGEKPNSEGVQNPFMKLLQILSKFIAYVAQAVTEVVKRAINSLYKKALSAILRSALGVMLVRIIIDRFGTAAVRNAWYDSTRVNKHVLNGYTKPLKAKGWDRALAEFTAATIASSESESKPPLSKRLHEISCPVLIITGDSDRIVPSWNAEKLSRAIPGSCLEVIKHCGHLPHEEKVEEFVGIVDKFLRNVFGDAKETPLQALA